VTVRGLIRTLRREGCDSTPRFNLSSRRTSAMRRSLSSRTESSVSSSSSPGSSHTNGSKHVLRIRTRRPSLGASSSSSQCNVSNVLAVGLDVDTMRMVLCDCVPHYLSGDEELLAMLDGLFAELDAAQLRQVGSLATFVERGAASNNSSSSTNNRRVEQILGNVVTVLTCFLDSCHASVPPVVIFHVHSLVGQVRDLVLRDPGSALNSYTKALWLASWSEDIPDACVARTLHRIGTVKGCVHRYDEGRKLLRQAVATYAASGIPPDHPAVVDCQRTLRDVDTRYWSTIGANEDSWSSLAGLADRRVPLPGIREEPHHPADPIGEYGAAAAAAELAGYRSARDAPSA
jgi:hypothetical protein